MHIIKTPYKYINEAGAIKKAGEYLAETGRKPLIIAGEKAGKAVEKELKKSLSDAGISTENYFTFKGYPSQNQFDYYANLAKEKNADFIIGIGGGRVIDTSKAAADIAGLSVVTVPTVCATCASWAALTIQYDDNGAYVKHRWNKKSPVIVLADPEVIFTAPQRYLFSGVVDTFAKFFEVRPTFDRHAGDTPTSISMFEAKLAYKNLEADTFKALEEAEKGVFGQAAENVIDAVIYLAGFTGSVKSRYGHYSFAHPFYHTSTQVLKSNVKLHGEKVAFGIVVQLILEGKSESEVLDAIKLFSKYSADFVLSDFNLEDEDLRFLSTQIGTLFPYAVWKPEEIYAAFLRADELTKKFRQSEVRTELTVEPRAVLKNLPPYRSARSLQTLQRVKGLTSVIKLAANENTLGFSENVWDSIRKNVTSQYPDGSAFALRSKIASRFGVELENVVIGNGSFELIYLTAIAFVNEGDETISAVPTFGWYKTATEIMGGKFIGVPVKDFKTDLDAIAEAVTERTKIIWLCNPNNPTGSIFTQKELEAFLAKIPENILVVLDEAYADFVTESDFPDSVPLIKKHGNLVSFRTFSKLEGLANFRVGYAIANRDFTALLTRIKIPSNVSGAGQAAALAAIDDEEFKKKTRSNADSQKELYYEAFRKHGFKYVKSNSNFIFFDIGQEAAPVVEKFLDSGILVRDGGEYGFPTMLRISIGSPEENKKVLDLFEKIF